MCVGGGGEIARVCACMCDFCCASCVGSGLVMG
jgi:hypothetical protein